MTTPMTVPVQDDKKAPATSFVPSTLGPRIDEPRRRVIETPDYASESEKYSAAAELSSAWGIDDPDGRQWNPERRALSADEYLTKMKKLALDLSTDALVTPELKEWEALPPDEEARAQHALKKRDTWGKVKDAVAGLVEVDHAPLTDEMLKTAPPEVLKANEFFKATIPVDDVGRPIAPGAESSSDIEAANKKIMADYKEKFHKRQAAADYEARLLADNNFRLLDKIRPILSSQQETIVNEAFRTGKLSPETIDKMREMDPNDLRIIAPLVHNAQAPGQKAFAKDAVLNFWNMVKDVPIDAGEAIFLRTVKRIGMDDEKYQKRAEIRSLMSEMLSDRAYEGYNFGEKAVIGAAGMLPYMAWMRIPYAGPAMIAAKQFKDMEDRVASGGGNVASGEFILTGVGASILYTAIENLQQFSPTKTLTSLEKRLAYRTLVTGAKDASSGKLKAWATSAAVVSGDVLANWINETNEEALQQTVEEVFVSWGLKGDILSAAVKGTMEGWKESFGTMGLVSLTHAGAAGGMSLSRKFSTEDTVSAIFHANALINAHKGADPASVQRQREVLGSMHREWRRLGGTEEAAVKMFVSRGLAPETAIQLHDFFKAEYNAIMSDPALTQAQKEALVGKNASALEIMRQVNPNADISEIDPYDARNSARVATILTDAGRPTTPEEWASMGAEDRAEIVNQYRLNESFDIREQVGGAETTTSVTYYPGAGFDPNSPEAATSIAETLTDRGEPMTAEQWSAMTPEEKQAKILQYGLYRAGQFVLKAKRQGGPTPDGADVSENQIASMTGAIGLQTGAEPAVAFHEDFHKYTRYMREAGRWSPQDVQKLREEFGDARPGVDEVFNEDRAANAYRAYVTASGKVNFIQQTLFEKAINTAFDIMDRFTLFRKKQEKAETTRRALFEQIMRGEYTGLPVGTVSEQQREQNIRKQVEDEARAKEERRAEAERKKQAKSVQVAPQAAQSPAPATPGQGADDEAAQAQIDSLKAPKQEIRREATPAQGEWVSSLPNIHTTISGHWAVVDLFGGVRTSDQPGYDMSIQPRDGSGTGRLEQIEDIRRDPRLDWLLESQFSNSGSPIATEAMDIMSGNGRIKGIRAAVETGTLTKEHLAEYMTEEAARRGITVPEGIEYPILVRVITKIHGKETMQEAAEFSNQDDMLQRTHAEQAEADASIIKSKGLLRLFRPSKDGNVLAASNADFIAAFVRAMRARAMLDKRGRPTEAAAARIQRAMLALVIGKGETARRTITTLIENAKSVNMTKVVDGAMIAAGEIAAISELKPDYALAQDLGTALQEYMQMRIEGKTAVEWLAQDDLLYQRPKTVAILIGVMAARRTSAGVASMLLDYAARVRNIDTTTADIFQQNVSDKVEILKLAVKTTANEKDKDEEADAEIVESGEAPAPDGQGEAPDQPPAEPPAEIPPEERNAEETFTPEPFVEGTISLEVRQPGRPWDYIGHNGKGVPTENAPKETKWSNAIPLFQGGKRGLSARATTAIRRLMTASERDSYNIIWDGFGGSGGWGLYHALENFRNVKMISIGEYNPSRMKKIQFFHQKGDKAAEVINSKEFQAIHDEIIDAMVEIDDENKNQLTLDGVAAEERPKKILTSAGTLANRAQKILDKWIATPDFADDIEAVVQAIADAAANGAQQAADTREQMFDTVVKTVIRDAAEIRKAAIAFAERAGTTVEDAFVYRTSERDTYSAELLSGPDVFTLLDPPYYVTTGYDEEKKRATKVVSIETYYKTRDLVRRAVAAGNGVLYTDSAWWMDNPEFAEKDYNLTVPDDHQILVDILNTLDHFDVASGTVGTRHEVIGVSHGHAEKTENTGGQGEGNGSVQPSVQPQTDGRIRQPEGTGDRQDQAVQGMAPGTTGEAEGIRGGNDSGSDAGPEAGQQPRLSIEAAPPVISREIYQQYRDVEGFGNPDESDILQGIKTNDPFLPQKVLEYWATIGFTEIANNDYPKITRAFEEALRLVPRRPLNTASISRFQGYQTASARDKYMKSFAPGREISIERPANAFSSDKDYGLDMAQTYGGNYLVEFVISNPQRGRDLGHVMGSKPGTEVLYGRGDKFRIKAIRPGVDEKHTVVVLEELDPETGIPPAARFNIEADRQTVPAFYSQLRRVIEAKMPNRASVQQVRGLIDPQKGSGIKADEIEWSGLQEFLDSKKPGDMVTKDEVLAATQDVVVQDVVKGSKPKAGKYPPGTLTREFKFTKNEGSGNYTVTDPNGEFFGEYESYAQALSFVEATIIDEDEEARRTKFENYVLPGGQNYRELLLTLPVAKDQQDLANHDEMLNKMRDDYAIRKGQINSDAEALFDAWYNNPTPDTEAELLDELGIDVDDYRDNEIVKQNAQYIVGYKSPHFSEPNILAHVRFNERTDANGKRVLFIEEIQSDWHQAGKKKGYFAELTPKETARLAELEQMLADGRIENRRTAQWLELDALKQKKYGTGVPDAPFKDTSKGWARLALKRMIRWAAENGFDRIAWTTGAQQADRYDLSKQISRVDVQKLATGHLKGHYAIRAYSKSNPDFAILDDAFPEDKLASTVGKDLAQKIIDDTAEGKKTSHSYSGLDLKVGGEGMIAFYDKILPNIANDLGKKFGAKVQDIDLGQKVGQPERELLKDLMDADDLDSTEEEADQYNGIIARMIGQMDEGKTYKQAYHASRQFEPPEAQDAITDIDAYIIRRMAKKTTTKAGEAVLVHALPITPEMRESVLYQGQPRFMVAAAYHGSPHEFDQFSTDKIGTGEGAQAYGWGLYFAGKKQVAEYYRNVLSPTPDIFFKGVNTYTQKAKWLDTYGETGSIALAAVQATGSIDLAIEKLADVWKDKEMVRKGRKWLRDNRENIRIERKKGKVYEVELAPDDDEWLDWDKPFSKQSAKMQKAIEELPDDPALDQYNREYMQRTIAKEYWDKAVGGYLYRAIASIFSREDNDVEGLRKTSQFLHKHGIRGIRYLDEGSRKPGTKKPTSNYVVFNDEDVKVKARYNIEAWTPEKGGRLYHGTMAPWFDTFRPGTTYLTTAIDETVPYAQGMLGTNVGTKMIKSRIVSVQASPGRVKDIDEQILEALMEGDVGVAIEDEAKIARAEGYRYMRHEHPGIESDRDFDAIISLYPDEDLIVADSRDLQGIPRNPDGGIARFSFEATRKRFSNDSGAVASLAVQKLAGKPIGTEDAVKAKYMFKASATTDQLLAEATRLASSKESQTALKALKSDDPTAALSIMAANAELNTVAAAREGLKTGIKMGVAAQRARQTAENRLIREAKGENLQSLIIDTGASMTETMLQSLPEQFTSKPASEMTDEEKAAAKEDAERRRLEREEREKNAPPADEAVLAAREKRMEQVIEAVKAQSSKRRAEREQKAAEAAAKAAEEGEGKEDDAEGGMDEDGEIEGEELAIPRELLEAHGIDLRSAEDMALFLRLWIADWIVRNSNGRITPQNIWQDRESVEIYRKTMIAQLYDMAYALVAPEDMALPAIIRQIEDIPSTAKPDTIERRARGILSNIQGNAIRQSRKQLIRELAKDITQAGISGKKQNLIEEDLKGKITGEHEKTARFIKKAIRMTPAAMEKEYGKLRQIIENRSAIYQDASAAGHDRRLDTDIEYHTAIMKIQILGRWGGLKNKLPSQIVSEGAEIRGWLVKAQERLHARWLALEESNAQKLDAIVPAVIPADKDKPRAKEGLLDKVAQAHLSSIQQRLEGIIRYAPDEDTRRRALSAISDVMMEINQGSTQYEVKINEYRDAWRNAVMDITGSHRSAAKYVKHLDDVIPQEVASVVSKQGYQETMTFGQALQLYASITQRSYAENVAKHERQGHAALLESIFTPEDMKLVNRLRDLYEGRRGELSAVVQSVTGIPIWRPDPLYMPVQMRRGSIGGLGRWGSVRSWSPLADSLTPRIRNGLDFDESVSIQDMFMQRAEDSARAIAFGARGLIIRGVLGKKVLHDAIERYYGDKVLRDLLEHITHVMDGTPHEDHDITDKAGILMRHMVSYMYLSGNISPTAKQSVSVPTFALAMDGDSDSLVNFILHRNLITAIKDWNRADLAEIMASDEYKARYRGGISPEIAEALADVEHSPILRAYRIGMTLVQMGDFVPSFIVMPGLYKAKRDALLKNGMEYEAAKKRAMTEAWAMLETSQQSHRIENIPAYYRKQATWKMFFLQFASAPLQQFSHEAHAYLDFRAGVPGAKQRLIRSVVINHIIMTGLMELATALVGKILGREPEKDEKLAFARIVSGLILGPMARILIVGTIATWIGEAIVTGKPSWGGSGLVPAEYGAKRIATDAGITIHDLLSLDVDGLQRDLVRMIANTSAPGRNIVEALENRDIISRKKR